MNRSKALFFVAFILLLGIPWLSEGYDVGGTHQIINMKAAESSNFDQYLKDYLGFYRGLDQGFAGKEVWRWLEEGGKEEDDDWRFPNHFHNPLKPWSEGEFDNVWCDIFYATQYARSPLSSILWAQQGQDAWLMENWTWGAAREYFHEALTAAEKDKREGALAKCFRALGQIMHLLADASVPAHTRNDAHIFPLLDDQKNGFKGYGLWTYETWCKWNNGNLNYSSKRPDAIILKDPNPDPSYSNLVPITGLWDRNQYTTGATPLIGTNIGLAEYSNANFFSLDTMLPGTYLLPNSTDCPHPDLELDIDGIFKVEKVLQSGLRAIKLYCYRTDASKGEPVEHLVTWSYFYLDLSNRVIPKSTISKGVHLDDECFKEYASHLIPRAVGYNAALLDYFFRGRLEITPPDRYLYGIADPGTKAFSEIQLKLRNTTPDEEMGAGVVTAVMKYRLPLNPDFDPVATAPLDTDYVDYDDPDHYAYSVSEPIQVGIISADDPEEFTFTFNGSIPTNALDLSLMVVYRGELGLEQDAVVAQYKDLCEPHHLRFWNNTDYCCVNGTLYSPSEITASPELSRQLDTNWNGKPDIYYFASPVNIYITFSGSTPTPEPTETTYTVAFHDVSPGNYGEVVVLQDQDIYYCSTLWNVIDSSPEDFPGFDFYWYIPDEEFPGHRTYFAYQTKNETDQMGNEFFNYQPRWHRLVPITFRGIPMQNGISFNFTHPDEIACEDSDWPEAPDAQGYLP